ncbi:hypothetical protein D3C73_1674490 [compost metagenome]
MVMCKRIELFALLLPIVFAQIAGQGFDRPQLHRPTQSTHGQAVCPSQSIGLFGCVASGRKYLGRGH